MNDEKKQSTRHEGVGGYEAFALASRIADRFDVRFHNYYGYSMPDRLYNELLTAAMVALTKGSDASRDEQDRGRSSP